MAHPNFQLSECVCKHCGQGADVVKEELLDKLQQLRDMWGKPMILDCVYRCPEHNAAVGGAHNSAHLYGQAADIADADGSLKAFVTEDVLEKLGLWAEDYSVTKTWLHVQIRPAVHRIFKP